MSHKVEVVRIVRGSQEWGEVQQLVAECQASDGLDVRLVAGQRSYVARDQAGLLIGYLAWMQVIPEEIELSGLVRPSHRRRGVFTALLQAAALDLSTVAVDRLLFITDPKSAASLELLHSLGASHDHNEYRMEMSVRNLGCSGSRRLALRPAQAADRPELARQNAICFGDGEDGEVNVTGVWLAEQDGSPVGKVEARLGDGSAFIYGLGVLPQYRRQGYGREILDLILEQLTNAGAHRFALEVASKNASALGLYQSVGFTVTAEYAYYALSHRVLTGHLNTFAQRLGGR